MKNLLKALALSFCVLLGGCAAFLTGGAVATGQVAKDHRTSGHMLDDIVLKARLTNAYASDVEQRFSKVTTKVNEGRVLLTGFVASEDIIHEAIKIAWEVKGVKEVISEINTNDHRTMWDRSKDMVIKSRIKSKYLLRRGFSSANYSVIVTDRVVYLFGIADSEAERDVAADIARRIKGVERVVNYVILKEDERRV